MKYPIWTYLGAFALGTMAYSAIDDGDLITYVTVNPTFSPDKKVQANQL